jgi:L-fucose isomerase-like protein
MVDDLFGGTGQVLGLSGLATREKLPVVAVSSSDPEDVASAARLFQVIRAMKETRILDVTDRDIAGTVDAAKALYGAELLKLTSEELNGYYSATDAGEAAEWAGHWIAGAKKVVEPSREEIVKSGRMYLALCKAAAERHADAVTVDCLGLFYGGMIPAYPCLGFFQMNNDGGTGVCEGDVNSTCTQLLMRYLTGRPGYVSDPVIDTSRDEVIYAHCVSTNRVYGPKGKANPYIIRSHAEDEQGASVQSLMPAGDTVTTLEISLREKRMVVHTGKSVGNSDEPKACRTKLVVKSNSRSLLRNWSLGWHRVTVYGDWREQAMNLGCLLGVEVFEEDRA